MEKDKSIGIRIDEEILGRFRYVSKCEFRSINAQIICLITNFVKDYEKANGEITEEDIKMHKDAK